MKALASALSNNILVRGERDNIPISPMKLQKLLYYVCRDYVQETGQSPIEEQFEVWQYGPVIPSVYGEFKQFGSRPITSYAKDAMGHSFIVRERSNPILSRVLDVAWAKYKNMSGVELSELTHKGTSGWYTAYVAGRDKITLEDMKNDRSG